MAARVVLFTSRSNDSSALHPSPGVTRPLQSGNGAIFLKSIQPSSLTHANARRGCCIDSSSLRKLRGWWEAEPSFSPLLLYAHLTQLSKARRFRTYDNGAQSYKVNIQRSAIYHLALSVIADLIRKARQEKQKQKTTVEDLEQLKDTVTVVTTPEKRAVRFGKSPKRSSLQQRRSSLCPGGTPTVFHWEQPSKLEELSKRRTIFPDVSLVSSLFAVVCNSVG